MVYLQKAPRNRGDLINRAEELTVYLRMSHDGDTLYEVASQFVLLAGYIFLFAARHRLDAHPNGQQHAESA